MSPLLPRRTAVQRFLARAARRRPAAGGGGQRAGWRAAARLLAGGLSASAALGALLVTSHVIGEVSGAGAVLAVLVASLVALITGLYQSELADRRPEPPAGLYSAAFASAGELAAFCSAWTSLVLRCAATAAAARAVSATVDHLTGGHVAGLVASLLGGQDLRPDPLAAGVCLMVGALLALGLESSAWMRCVVLLTTVGSAGCYAVSAAFFTGRSNWGRQPLLPGGLVGLAEASAVFSVAMWRGPVPSRRLVRQRGLFWDGPRLTAAACGLLFLGYCALSTASALVQRYHGPISSEQPMLPGLREHGLLGAELAVGCGAVAALALALVELAAPQSAQLAALSADGLLPGWLGGAAAATALPAAAAAAAAALLSTLQLLRVAASCQLLLAAGLLVRALVERYAAPAAAGAADRRRPPGRRRPEAPLQRLKAGLATLPDRLGHGVAVIGGDAAPLLAVGGGGGGAHPACGCGPPAERRLLLRDDDESDSACDSDSDRSDDTDIDAIVAEYRHSVQFQPGTVPALLLGEEPSPGSARRVALCLAAFVACSAAVGAALVLPAADAAASPAALMFAAALLVVCGVLVLIVSRQPWSADTAATFQAPGCPLLPCAALLLAVVGQAALLQHVWPLLTVVMATGFLIYVFYGSLHSGLGMEHTAAPRRDLMTLQALSAHCVAPATSDVAPRTFQTTEPPPASSG